MIPSDLMKIGMPDEKPVVDEIDPVLRCDSCQKLVKRATLHKIGSCPKCGNRRIRNLTVMDENELQQVKDWGFTEFASEWGAVDED